MAELLTVEMFRQWSGANTPATVPAALIEQCLAEAEAGVASDVTLPMALIAAATPPVRAIATGDALRRASRLLARRNSPESLSGSGTEGFIAIPSRDPDSAAAVRQIRLLLAVREGVA